MSCFTEDTVQHECPLVVIDDAGLNDTISRQTAIDEFYQYPNINWTTLDVMEKIDKVPSIDAVPVIRCKDCKHAHMTYDGDCKYCDVWFPDEAEYLDGDYYCASAERKEQ